MTRYFSLTLALLSAFALQAQTTITRVVAQTADETLIEVVFGFKTPQTVQTPEGEAIIPTVEGGTSRLEAGAPDLPKVAVPLMISRQGAWSAEIVDQSVATENNVLVAPSKGNLSRQVDPNNVPFTFGPAYSMDKWYPENVAEQKSPFIFRDARGQVLWVSPYQYNPATRTLTTRASVTIRLTHTGVAGENEITALSNAGLSPTFDQLYQKFFVNYDRSRLAVQRAQVDPEKMLVIVKDDLAAELQPLVDWKRKMGIHTTVVHLSEIGSTQPADVYNFVKTYYEQHQITYLLVVADEVAMPPMLRPGSIYSCDNCLGYMEGADHFPEVLVGRYHASNANQLRLMVLRNLDYEVTPLADTVQNWCATGMASCSNEGQGIGDDGQADYEHGNEWKAAHLADGYEKYWEFYDGNHGSISPTPGDETADQPGNPSNAPLVSLMNGRGVSLYNYTGHGWEQGLASGDFSTSAVAQLRNDHRFPIIIAVACCAGNFTNGECLGEAVQRAGDPNNNRPWGTIAAFLSSDFQSWSPPMEGQDAMNQYLTDADGVTLRPVIGAMGAYGNALMIAAYDQGGIDMADVWNPFFEPSFVPRTRLPQTLTVNHDAGVFLGATSLTATSSVEGAMVSLYYQDQTLATGFIENGSVTLDFPAIAEPQNMVLTATQFNYAPYQSEIIVAPASGPYVVNQAFAINDLSANANGKLDYGETVQLDLTLRNIGVETANATFANLLAVDPWITVLDATENFGDIEDSTTVTRPGAFELSVAPNAPDDYVVELMLEVEYGAGQSFTYTLTPKIQAPVIKVNTISIAEGANSDADGRFESGESLTVTVNTSNNGHSASSVATGVLSTPSTWLSIVNPSLLMGTLDAGENQTLTFDVLVAPDAPMMTSADMAFVAQAGPYQDDATIESILINPIIENFETQNFQYYPWEMSGDAPWTITTFNPYSGAYCARSGTIGHNKTSQLNLTRNFVTDGEVSFVRKVGSAENGDFLRFYIDDIMVGEWSGNLMNWEAVAFPITSGVHKLTWSYEKDAAGIVSPDRAFIDDIIMPVNEEVVGADNPNARPFHSFIFPNPAQGAAYLQLNLPDQDEVAIDVIDCTGRVVRSIARKDYLSGRSLTQLPIQGLTSGVYFVGVRGGSHQATHRLVVE